ncbi:serine hydrolase domain-containing protein [Ferdinandcohnia quinoae]|uniref:Beta-lactamase family protein n=1 Tax=Fredinandcohnia quinoae TaxID=2918902 RepID=A0AAW5E4P9_9BACI|nr:serine hydrolase domain-containing protein [Fredinandcohnia sp. SECRCQ15]MCH1624565.1 beta-lactamase family protein [Fredinandcohnia sp. SECRCQ15]
MKVVATSGKFITFSLLFCLIFFVLPTCRTSAEVSIKNALDQYIESFLEEQKVPGASIAIIKDNKVIYTKNWGVTGETENKVSIETPFLLGSISKSLTGFAIFSLIEEGRIALDEPVQSYIPWFSLKNHEAATQITIKQLLTHTSGISTYAGLSIADKGSNELTAIKESAKSLSTVEPTATPGEKYQYSDANYLILGAVIEEITQQLYSQFMEENIFTPIGMEHTAADNETAYAKGYLGGYQSWFGIPVKSLISYDNGGSPYGYIAASAKDMASFISFLFQQEQKDGLNQYFAPLLKTTKDRYYGYGWRITTSDDQEEMIWHSGSTPDSRSEIFLFPESKWGGVILTNKNHILEENALLQLRNGIINIVKNEVPSKITRGTPIFQLIILGFVLLLVSIVIVQIARLRIHRSRNKALRIVTGVILFILSVFIIPILIKATGSPWNSIKVFAPDIALMTILIVILLALNGLLVIYKSIKKGNQLT